jgi:phosphatidylinositol 3-kinase
MCRFLQRIIKYPPTRDIQADEKQLLWKFRFSLMSEKKALTKFVRSVDWSDIQVSKSIQYLSGPSCFICASEETRGCFFACLCLL